MKKAPTLRSIIKEKISNIIEEDNLTAPDKRIPEIKVSDIQIRSYPSRNSGADDYTLSIRGKDIIHVSTSRVTRRGVEFESEWDLPNVFKILGLSNADMHNIMDEWNKEDPSNPFSGKLDYRVSKSQAAILINKLISRINSRGSKSVA